MVVGGMEGSKLSVTRVERRETKEGIGSEGSVRPPPSPLQNSYYCTDYVKSIKNQ